MHEKERKKIHVTKITENNEDEDKEMQYSGMGLIHTLDSIEATRFNTQLLIDFLSLRFWMQISRPNSSVGRAED